MSGPLLAASSIRFRWTEVVRVPPVEKPPVPLWWVKLTRPELLDGGKTWLDAVEFSDVEQACRAAIEVDAAFEELWRAREVKARANQNVYTVTSREASTTREGVTYRSDRRGAR